MKHPSFSRILSLFILFNSQLLFASSTEDFFEYEYTHSRLEKIHITRNVLTIYTELPEPWEDPDLYVIMTEFLDFYSSRPDEYKFIQRSDPHHFGLHPNPEEIIDSHYHIEYLRFSTLDMSVFRSAMQKLVEACYLTEESAYHSILDFSNSQYLTRASSLAISGS